MIAIEYVLFRHVGNSFIMTGWGAIWVLIVVFNLASARRR